PGTVQRESTSEYIRTWRARPHREGSEASSGHRTEGEGFMAAENVQTLTDSNFEVSVLKAGEPVLVDFWAEWCGPCKRLAPTVDALATDYGGKVTFGKLNVDENPDTTIKFNVRGIPALLLFKGGQVVDQVVGLVPKEDIKKVIDRHLDKPAG